MINPTLANVIGNNAGPGAEIFQEVALMLQSIYQKQTWKVTYIINYWPLETSTQPLIKACVMSIINYAVNRSVMTRISTSRIPDLS